MFDSFKKHMNYTMLIDIMNRHNLYKGGSRLEAFYLGYSYPVEYVQPEKITAYMHISKETIC